MDAKTRSVLEESIVHWEEIVATPPKAVGELVLDGRGCRLCEVFSREVMRDAEGEVVLDEEGEPKYCGGCPVSEKTGEDNCKDTPWYGAWRRWRYGDLQSGRNWKEWQEAAGAELEFLKSLRQQKEGPEATPENTEDKSHAD